MNRVYEAELRCLEHALTDAALDRHASQFLSPNRTAAEIEQAGKEREARKKRIENRIREIKEFASQST